MPTYTPWQSHPTEKMNPNQNTGSKVTMLFMKVLNHSFRQNIPTVSSSAASAGVCGAENSSGENEDTSITNLLNDVRIFIAAARRRNRNRISSISSGGGGGGIAWNNNDTT